MGIVHAVQVVIGAGQQDTISQTGSQMNILLLGQPTSHRNMQQDSSMPRTSLKAGDVIGIHSGLTWEIELHDNSIAEEERRVVASSQSPASEDDDVMDTDNLVRSSKKWQVAAEWDLLIQS